MHFTSFLEDGTLTVALNGEIDHHTAKIIRDEIDRAIFYYRAKTLLLTALTPLKVAAKLPRPMSLVTIVR